MIRKKRSKHDETVKVTFILPKDQPYGEVSVVGDFNEWDPAAHPLVRRSNQTYSSAVTLDAGQRYRFRYFTEDGQWVNDETADGFEENGFGSDNCILLT